MEARELLWVAFLARRARRQKAGDHAGVNLVPARRLLFWWPRGTAACRMASMQHEIKFADFGSSGADAGMSTVEVLALVAFVGTIAFWRRLSIICGSGWLH